MSKMFTVNEVSKALDRVRADFEIEGARLAVITEDKYDDVLQVVGENFLPDEPISIAYGLERCQEWDEVVRSWLRLNLSVMMVHTDTGDVMGVTIICVSTRHASSPNLQHEPLRNVFRFLTDREHESDIFNKIGVDTIFHFCLIAVRRKYRQYGLGTKLMGACIELGRVLGFKAVDSQATSNYSQKIFKRYGFEVLHEVPYVSVLHNGEPLRNKTHEHVSSQVVVKRL